MHTLKLTAVLFAGALLAGVACTSNPPAEKPLADRLAERGYLIGDKVERVQNYRINGWNAVDRRNVIMNAGPGTHYLITLRNPCDGLRSAEKLAFSTTVGDLTDKDYVVVRGTGNFIERCVIDGIYELEKLPRSAAADSAAD